MPGLSANPLLPHLPQTLHQVSFLIEVFLLRLLPIRRTYSLFLIPSFARNLPWSLAGQDAPRWSFHVSAPPVGSTGSASNKPSAPINTPMARGS